jgi:phosphopantothenoylcysteine decarboxylase/phosphopantothenate--cysteine ligase
VVILAPAMNDRMWANPIVQRNVAVLKQHGFTTVGPGEGWLACRSIGPGRMAEATEILDAVAAMLKSQPAKKM